MFSLIRKLNRKVGGFFSETSERVSRFVRSSVALFERPFEILFGGLTRSFDKLDRVDELLLGLLRLALWPFRMLWRALVGLVRLVTPQPVRQFFVQATFSGRARLANSWGALVRLAESLNLDRPIRWLVWLLQPIWRPIAAVLGFVYAFLASRNYRQALWGVPAVLMAGPLVALGGVRYFRGPGGVSEMYSVAAKQAREDKDYEKSNFYERKLAQLGADTKSATFRSALALAEEGKIAEAYEKMKPLASTEETTFPAANIWIVQQLLSKKIDLPDGQSHELAGKHLDAIDKALRMGSLEVDMLRAFWLAEDGKTEEAVKKLEPLKLKLPEAALTSMQFNLQLKQVAKARNDAQILHDFINKRRRNKEPLSQLHCEWWAMAEELLGDDEQLLLALREWLKHAPENPRAKLALSEVYRRQFEREVSAAAPSVDRLYQLLTDAARHPASRVWSESQIRGIMAARQASPLVGELVQRLVDEPATPPVLIEAVGTWYALQNDSETARKLLKRSLEADDSNAIGWNNYAWALGEGENPDLEAALAAAEKALKLSPEEFRFRETRGQIYLKLGRWRDAIADLEVAVNGMPELGSIHDSLAKAYDAVGEKELAELHRQAAK